MPAPSLVMREPFEKSCWNRQQPTNDSIQVDNLGNVLVSRSGQGTDRLKVMVAAHMDEIGFMLTYDDGEGIFRFETVGGIDPRQLPGKPVWIGAG